MIDIIKENKLIIGIVIFLIAGAVWYGISGGASGQPTSLLETQDVSEAAAEEERAILDLIFQLREIELAGTIFNNPAFVSLRDFRTEIVSEPVGRRNPFAPLSEVGTSTEAASTTVKPAGSPPPQGASGKKAPPPPAQ